MTCYGRQRWRAECLLADRLGSNLLSCGEAHDASSGSAFVAGRTRRVEQRNRTRLTATDSERQLAERTTPAEYVPVSRRAAASAGCCHHLCAARTLQLKD
eukprot:5205456-Prymnesium_polylepis.1